MEAQKVDLNSVVFDTMTSVQLALGLLKLMRDDILRLQSENTKLKEEISKLPPVSQKIEGAV